MFCDHLLIQILGLLVNLDDQGASEDMVYPVTMGWLCLITNCVFIGPPDLVTTRHQPMTARQLESEYLKVCYNLAELVAHIE